MASPRQGQQPRVTVAEAAAFACAFAKERPGVAVALALLVPLLSSRVQSLRLQAALQAALSEVSGLRAGLLLGEAMPADGGCSLSSPLAMEGAGGARWPRAIAAAFVVRTFTSGLHFSHRSRSRSPLLGPSACSRSCGARRRPRWPLQEETTRCLRRALSPLPTCVTLVLSLTYGQVLSYRADAWLASSPASKPLLLLGLTLYVALCGWAALYAFSPDTLTDAAWSASLGSPFDPSFSTFSSSLRLSLVTLAGLGLDQAGRLTEGPQLQRATGLCVSLAGMLCTAFLVGLITDSLTRLLDSLRQGLSPVLEVNHSLVLGWSDKLVPIVQARSALFHETVLICLMRLF